MIDPNGEDDEYSLSETVGDLKKSGVQGVESEAASHKSSKVGSTTVGNIGGQTKEEVAAISVIVLNRYGKLTHRYVLMSKEASLTWSHLVWRLSTAW